MPVQVERVPNKNIIILYVSGEINLEQVQAAYAETARLLQDMQGVVYRITDVGDQTMDYGELLRIVDAAASGQAGSLTDARIRPIWIGESDYSQRARELLRDRDIIIPLFGTLDEAMIAIDRMLADQSESSDTD